MFSLARKKKTNNHDNNNAGSTISNCEHQKLLCIIKSKWLPGKKIEQINAVNK